MLARSVEQVHNRLEHLVVELKAPRVKIGSQELTQIKTYAYAVVTDERFNKLDVSWDFVVVSNDLDDFAEHRTEPDRPERGPSLAAGQRAHMGEDLGRDHSGERAPTQVRASCPRLRANTE